jgi:hypothetical protein
MVASEITKRSAYLEPESVQVSEAHCRVIGVHSAKQAATRLRGLLHPILADGIDRNFIPYLQTR